MKISMTVTIDVNPDEWCTEFGQNPTEVRDDVKSYMLTLIQECGPSADGIVRSVELKR